MNESPFRIALVVVILLTMAVTVYHRLQAAKSDEKISHKDESYLFAWTGGQERLLASGRPQHTLLYLPSRIA